MTRKHIKEMGKDTMIYGVSSVLSQVAGVFLVPFYTRALHPSDYGVVAVGSMTLAFISPLATLGMDGALFRFYSLSADEARKAECVTSAFVVKMAATVLMVAALVPAYGVINRLLFEGLLTPLMFGLLLGTFFFDGLTTLTIAWLRSERKVLRIAANNLIVLAVSLALSIYFVLVLKMGIQGALLAGLMSAVFRALLLTRETIQTFTPRSANLATMRELLAYGLPMIPHKLQGQAIVLFTTFIINHELGIVATGLYVVAQKMAKPLSLFVGMVQQSWTPYKFQIHKSESAPEPMFRNLIMAYWVGLLVLWGLLSIVTPWLFRVLINERYWDGIPYVPFIMFVSVAQAFYFTITTGFELSSNQKRLVLASFSGLVALVAISLLTLHFFPPFSFIVAQAVSFFVMAAVIWPEARRKIRIDYSFGAIVAMFLFTCACIILACTNESVPLKFASAVLLLVGALYCAHTLLPGGFDKLGGVLWRRGSKSAPFGGPIS